MTDDPRQRLLDAINAGAAAAHAGDLDAALAGYEDAIHQLSDGGSLRAPRIVVDLRLRCANVLERKGDRDAALQACSEALRTACEEADDEPTAQGVVRTTMEMIRGWQDWARLEATGRGIVALGYQRNSKLMVMEAGWHMPYAYRGLGRVDEARDYADTILGRMRELGAEEAIAEWTAFLDSLSS